MGDVAYASLTPDLFSFLREDKKIRFHEPNLLRIHRDKLKVMGWLPYNKVLITLDIKNMNDVDWSSDRSVGFVKELCADYVLEYTECQGMGARFDST